VSGESYATFTRWSGSALIVGGLLTLLVNALLTPLLPHHVSFEITAASQVFLWRQSASAVAGAMLLFGCVGLHLRQADHAGMFGTVAFFVAFLGSALLLAVEWNEIFIVRDLAFRAPATLRILDGGPGVHLYDLGAVIPLAVFVLGWFALAGSTLRLGILSRRAAGLVIAGLLATPLLTAALPELWGAVIGNAILAAGWIWLGYDVRHPRALEDVGH
jgi:hypothetical protein